MTQALLKKPLTEPAMRRALLGMWGRLSPDDRVSVLAYVRQVFEECLERAKQH